MIITVGGRSGAGKTSVARKLSSELGYKFYSMGDLRGKMAMERGMTIDELNEIGKKEIWTDKEVDEFQKKLGKQENHFIIEGWLSFYFIPYSFKVFLDVNPEAAAKRIFKNQRPDEEAQKTIRGVLSMVRKRMAESQKRYKRYYGVDCFCEECYDLVINTTNLTISQVVDKIITELKIWKSKNKMRRQKRQKKS
ncbi:cytidylate kinase family protein [Candidatus Falkowbacteria bacterium]|nr:cytidylate kinase family protein [Candidatus Falkowbacteria bacterium]